MGTSKNKSRQTLTPVSIQKPIKPATQEMRSAPTTQIQLRNGLFVALENGYIVPATPSTPIEGCCINDVHIGDETKEPAKEGFDRMCIYYPKRRWETFTIDVENGEISQEDVGQTFLIIGELQHINYTTKAENGGQFRLEQVITPTRGEFTYAFDSSLSPQGPKGEDGETPTFTFSPVQTLPVGSDANLIVDQDGNNYDLTFQIPAGANGADGAPGTPGPKGEDGETIDLRIGQVTGGGTAAADIRVVTPTMRELDLTLPKGEDGEDGLSPTPRNEWNSGYTYEYLDIVRYPDQDGVGCSWIWRFRDTPAGPTDIPGESDGWMLLNVDGANGEQGEPGGTIVVPVEGKPGKDGAPGAPGTPGKDGDSPHNEGERDPDTIYTRLAMVRASTGEFDPWGNEIFGYYITQGGVAAGEDAPKDNPAWQLLSKDGMAGDGNLWSAMTFITANQAKTGSFDGDGNGVPTQVTFTHHTGNHGMVTADGINIIKDGHYRVYGHIIVQNNTGGSNMYINLGRGSIHLSTSRNTSGNMNDVWLATAKQGGAYATTQGPWLDLTMDCEVDLYEGDILTMYYRPQTDTNGAEGSPYGFTFMGSLDPTGDVRTYLGGRFATYLGVEWIGKTLHQKDQAYKFIQSI